MEKFFQRFTDSPKITVSIEEIIPFDSTKDSIRKRAVYESYATTIKKRELDSKLGFFRQKALIGMLNSGDFSAMNDLLTEVNREARNGDYKNSTGKESNRFYAYARVNSIGMLIAQILFVNNSIQEGLMERIEKKSIEKTIDEVSELILEYSKKNRAPVTINDAKFYGILFLLQAAFDKYFVPDEDIVTYNINTGDYQTAESYDDYTLYLNLSNRKVITAKPAEQKLCYSITTGWGKGIDLKTWNRLNKYYYEAISPTTGKANLFTKNYDVILERMLPQFRLARVKLAEEVLNEKQDNEILKIVEIGAGSGAFPIELIMACKRLGIPVDQVEYHGVEPSQYMRDNFRNNIDRKIGDNQMPKNWKLVEGSLEKVNKTPEQYIHKKEKPVIVICYAIHHCFFKSVNDFFENKIIRNNVNAIFVLDAIIEHGWTKPYYMWADCESPENFDNVTTKGIWDAKTVWTEPSAPIDDHCVTNAWANLRKLV